MLSLRPLQRAIDAIYRVDVRETVDDFVRPMHANARDAARREVVLVHDAKGTQREAHVALMLDPAIETALKGEPVAGLSRFAAWCLALEGVSHFVLLAYRAANDRPVSQLELELQADVDKFAVALVDRAMQRAPSEAHHSSQRLRHALFDGARFLDGPRSVRGRRYRLANRLAARYAESLERRYVRDGRLQSLVEELGDFYRAGLDTKRAMAEAA